MGIAKAFTEHCVFKAVVVKPAAFTKSGTAGSRHPFHRIASSRKDRFKYKIEIYRDQIKPLDDAVPIFERDLFKHPVKEFAFYLDRMIKNG
jgi:hypothetical protein